MRKINVLIIIVLTLFALAGMASAGGNPDFTLINDTGVTFINIQIAPSDSNNWGENILSSPFNDGDALDILFPIGDGSIKSWDLQGTSDTSVTASWHGLILNNIHVITLQSDGSVLLE